MNARALGAPALRFARSSVFAALTPLLEKNVLKTMTLDVPVIFSMSRIHLRYHARPATRDAIRSDLGGAGGGETGSTMMMTSVCMSVLDGVNTEFDTAASILVA